jgi:hypothetical protein
MLNVGTISWGTLRSQDLIGSFMDVLIDHDLPTAHALQKEYREVFQNIDNDEFMDASEDATWLVEALFEALNEIAPPFCYFGATDGDGADFGFWADDEMVRKSIEHAEPVPNTDYRVSIDDLVLWEVNDHGNVTGYHLLNAAQGRSKNLHDHQGPFIELV